MSEITFQTVQLRRGRHSLPETGACVMELASMLAGERFSDHPKSVCPAIGIVMRAYNDGIDDARRQDLYHCASACVGTRDRRSRAETTARFEEFFGLKPWRVPFARRTRERRVGRAAKRYALGASDDAHAAFVRLIDELTGQRTPVEGGLPLGPVAASGGRSGRGDAALAAEAGSGRDLHGHEQHVDGRRGHRR